MLRLKVLFFMTRVSNIEHQRHHVVLFSLTLTGAAYEAGYVYLFSSIIAGNTCKNDL